MDPKPGPAIPPYRRRWRFDNTRERAKVENPMASDFWAGYISGAIGIIIGNPLDVIKVQLQAGQAPAAGEAASASTTAATATAAASQQSLSRFESASSLVRGAAAPIIGYGALNAILFVAYNRSLMLLDPSITDPTNPEGVSPYKLWIAGAAGGLASWTISSPTEYIKCRAQLDRRPEVSSWTVVKDIVRNRGGWRGLYYAGGITSARDSIGYGFYFWSYEYCKRLMATEDEDAHQVALRVLLCGGIAGVVTWASVFPLDVVKTRLQAQPNGTSRPENQPLLPSAQQTNRQELGTLQMTKEIYRNEGMKAFYRGLGVCSLRAFIVNAVQWAAYEWLMKAFNNVT